MIPVHDTKVTSGGLALLTSMFRGRKGISGLLAAHLNRQQEIEDALWTAILQRNLDDGAGYVLDVLGQLVGEPRGGRDDEHYQAALGLRILINRSFSLLPDILEIVDTASDGEPWDYVDAFPAGFRINFAGDVPHVLALLAALAEVRPLGVRCDLVWSDAPLSTMLVPSWLAPGDVAGANGPSWSDGNPVAVVPYAFEVTPS